MEGRTGWARIAVVLALTTLTTTACTRALVMTEPGLPRGGIAPGKPETGVASWYGPGFHGRRTSNGEVYDQHRMTAAHRTLPFDTRVMVTNLDNNRSVEVRINDRGPFARRRVIDLSRSAAAAVGMIGPGTAPVRLDVVARPEGGYSRVVHCVQVGAFRRRERAEALRAELAGRYGDVYLISVNREGDPAPIYRVRIGPFLERRSAESRAVELASSGFPAVIAEEPRP